MVNKKRPKHNFSVSDVTRVLVTLWIKDDFFFLSPSGTGCSSHHPGRAAFKSAHPSSWNFSIARGANERIYN